MPHPDLSLLNLPLYELRDELVLRLYGAVGALRDLEAMHKQKKKPALGAYHLLLSAAQARVLITRLDLLDLIDKEPSLFEETFRALRFSQEPRIAETANLMKRQRCKTFPRLREGERDNIAITKDVRVNGHAT